MPIELVRLMHNSLAGALVLAGAGALIGACLGVVVAWCNGDLKSNKTKERRGL